MVKITIPQTFLANRNIFVVCRLTRMFWKFHTGAVSHVDTLLDKEGVTLQEILEQEDIIQECKSQNKKLVEL